MLPLNTGVFVLGELRREQFWPSDPCDQHAPEGAAGRVLMKLTGTGLSRRRSDDSRSSPTVPMLLGPWCRRRSCLPRLFELGQHGRVPTEFHWVHWVPLISFRIPLGTCSLQSSEPWRLAPVAALAAWWQDVNGYVRKTAVIGVRGLRGMRI